MDALSALQQQVTAQISSINTTLQNSSVTASVRSDLTGSASVLQGFLDKILLGQTLTAADQQALQNSLDTSQKALLAAQAQRTQLMILGVGGLVTVGVIVFLVIRHYKKKGGSHA